MATRTRNMVPRLRIMKFESKPTSANVSFSYSSSGSSNTCWKTSSLGKTSKVAIVIKL